MAVPTRPMKHTTTEVEVIPTCDLPHDEPTTAYADARMVRNAGRWTGSWASLCKDHFDEFGCELGLGRGQQYLQVTLDPDRRKDWIPGDRPSETPDYACQHCGKPGGH